MNEIERRFLQLAEQNEACDIWVAQWKLARKSAPMMLDVISHVFPHYSLHNASHSEAILNNITIILGKEAVGKLSVVDLWLMLNAAYYHDCGMVVDGEDKNKLFEDESKFVKFVEEKQGDKSSPMHEYAHCLEIKDGKLYYANNQLTAQSYEAVRFLLADYVRDAHADRSAHKVEEVFQEQTLTGVIPKRIVGLLSRICAAHMQGREQVMELPFEQTSACGIEPCHPRFVAFLLRLGDLLDVDNNRLSDVMLHSLGSIPVDSQDYNEINRSISLLNITRRTIEITAECNNYKVAEVTNKWFKWLYDEVVFVGQHWHDIAPEEGFGMLPTIGKLEVKLKGYDTIDGKNRPVFKIDTAKAMEMIQGAGLYSNPALCIRELLQNAADATYLRAFKEHPDTTDYVGFFQQLKAYPIKVTIVDKTLGENGPMCTVSIKDQGIGMSKKDLEYLFNTGSSANNKEKRELMGQMKDFMRPSGVFGIGFQSVFLISDKVNLQTRKWNKEETYQVEMNNPSGPEKGAILIQTKEDDSVPMGTEIRFTTQQKAHRESYDSGLRKRSFPSFYQYAKNYDFAKAGAKIDYTDFSGLIDEVFKFGESSPVPVTLDYNGTPYQFDGQGTLAFFDEQESIGVELIGVGQSDFYYRNQMVRYRDWPFLEVLGFKINLLFGDARDWLSLNRESIKETASDAVRKKVNAAVARYLELNKTSADEDLKRYISLTLDILRNEIEADEVLKKTITFDNLWQSVSIPFENDAKEVVPLSIGEFLGHPTIKLGITDAGHYRYSFEIEKDERVLKLREEAPALRKGIFRFLVKKLSQYYTSVFYDSGYYILSKEAQPDIVADNEETKEQLLDRYKRHNVMARDHFPCSEKYKVLRVASENEFYPILIKVPLMVCPYRRIPSSGPYDNAKALEYDVDDTILDYVFKHRLDPSVTKEQIAAAYEQFRQDFQTAVANVNAGHK